MSSETEYELLFVVDGVSVNDEEASIVLTDSFDATLSWSRGVHRLSISGNGRGAIEAVLNLLPELSSTLPRLKVLRLDPDLVGVPDIAQRTGRTRQSVQQWVTGERNANPPFPLPEGSAGRALVWRWASVNDWLRPLALDDHAVWPTRAESTYIDAILLDWQPGDLLLPPTPTATVVTPVTPVPDAGTSGPHPARAQVTMGGNVATAVLSGHKSLIARIPTVTGRELSDWFSQLEAGPAFLRREERAQWLADEHGIADRYAAAIVREYEIRRRLRLFGS